LTALKIESIDCAKDAETIKSASKKRLVFFIVGILDLVYFYVIKNKFKLKENYLAPIQHKS
jgi:hypothetical protein